MSVGESVCEGIDEYVVPIDMIFFCFFAEQEQALSEHLGVANLWNAGRLVCNIFEMERDLLGKRRT